MRRSVFDFENEERVESPERLNEYIRVANPGTWILVMGLVLVFVAFIVWGFTGTIPEWVTLKCVVDDVSGNYLDALLDASRFDGDSLLGKEATYRLPSGVSGRAKVIETNETPYSRNEIVDVLNSDFLAATLVDADYSYILVLEPEEDLDGHGLEIGQVTIITNEVPPVSFLLR